MLSLKPLPIQVAPGVTWLMWPTCPSLCLPLPKRVFSLSNSLQRDHLTRESVLLN